MMNNATAAANLATETLRTVNWDFAGAKTNHSTHGLHPYPAKYIPQIPANLIKELSSPEETVADIFCGSGTTLVEALSLGRNTIGVDASPLACLISEAKTTRLSPQDSALLNDLIKRAAAFAGSLCFEVGGLFASSAETFRSEAPRPAASDTLNFWFDSFVIEELAEILSWCNALASDAAKKIAKVAFSSVVVAVSKQDSDTRYVRREKNLAPGETTRRFARSLESSVKAVEQFNRSLPDETLTCQVHHANILAQPDIGSVDLVVCSPPYPNAFSYHLYHMTRMLWLGMDQPGFKRDEIGSHRKYSSKGANAATPETFRNEMRIIFGWLRKHLKKERYACFVVGNSTIRGESIDNARLVSEAAEENGFRQTERLDRNMQATKKAFNPAHGRIKTEQILILQKTAE